MKKLLISAVLALTLVALLAVPAVADDEQSVEASVTVGEYVSITLDDVGDAGIQFGPVVPGVTYSDVSQGSGTPAIKVNVESETNVNVDIGIKGETSGALALENWKYSETFAGSKVSIPAAYGTGVYSGVAPGTAKDFYHWVTVPAGTGPDTYNATVYYKAVETGTSFE